LDCGLALLPFYLADGVKLEDGGKDKVDGHEAVGVRVSGGPSADDVILFFDTKSRLLVKSKRRMQHPVTQKPVDGEVILGNYKQVSGVQYPHRITTFIDGKKIVHLEITQNEFLKKLDDRLFEKPNRAPKRSGQRLR
jgi:hypothetical protein